MSYLIALLCLALVAAAVTIYRLSGELRECQAQLRAIADLPAEHPQKRKPKTIRAKPKKVVE